MYVDEEIQGEEEKEEEGEIERHYLIIEHPHDLWFWISLSCAAKKKRLQLCEGEWGRSYQE